jgi:UDPglucose--hexose-1-phosphate uridylyltransferase
MSELRYHPFLDQWVITATHRQDRTFFPPPDYNPLAPTQPGGFPTEVPFPDYDLVVFENKFPSLSPHPQHPAVPGSALTPVRPSGGVCEVVCYTEDPSATLAQLPLSQVRKLTRVWKDRYLGLGARPEVEYVFIFENKGKEIGVTLAHPHGQIYAYPFIPPIPKEELAQERAYFEQHGRSLMAAVLEETGPTVVWENELFVAFVPFFARYPYEVYLTTKVHVPSLATMSSRDLDLLAEALLVVTRKYDALFGFSLPYIMAMHQAPTVHGYDFAWFHVEFYPPYRTANKLKYLAGSEAGAGAFINDTLPEVTASTLRDLVVEVPAV